MIHNQPVFINGDGETSRDFCYIANTVQANLLAATAVVYVIGNVLFGSLSYETWSAIAGSTIWCKFFFSYALSRHAHAVDAAAAKKASAG